MQEIACHYPRLIVVGVASDVDITFGFSGDKQSSGKAIIKSILFFRV